MRYSLKLSALMFACALAALAWSYALHRWRIARGHRFCPGPRRPLAAALLNPWCWCISSRCGYNLSGLRAADSGALTCPECGRHIRSAAHAPAHTGRIRFLRIALGALTVGWLIGLSDFVRTGAWAAHAPDWLVIAHRAVLGQHGSRRLLQQADERLDSGVLTPAQVRWMIPSYIDDLRDDDIRWNADAALSFLFRWRSVSVPYLDKALGSGDYQQRQLAAHVLRGIWESNPDSYRPSDALLAVTVEGLRSDTLPCQPAELARDHGYHYLGINNAREGVNFLCQLPDRAAPLLKDAMLSGDDQARTLAAGIVCLAHIDTLFPAAVPIMAVHLKDNNISLDANFAAAALLRAGPDGVQYLTLDDSADQQQRTTAQLIAWDLLHDDGEGDTIRRLLQVISTSHNDPARLGAAGIGYSEELPDWPVDAAAFRSSLAR